MKVKSMTYDEAVSYCETHAMELINSKIQKVHNTALNLGLGVYWAKDKNDDGYCQLLGNRGNANDNGMIGAYVTCDTVAHVICVEK